MVALEILQSLIPGTWVGNQSQTNAFVACHQCPCVGTTKEMAAGNREVLLILS
jgi:hypothetical protein